MFLFLQYHNNTDANKLTYFSYIILNMKIITYGNVHILTVE